MINAVFLKFLMMSIYENCREIQKNLETRGILLERNQQVTE